MEAAPPPPYISLAREKSAGQAVSPRLARILELLLIKDAPLCAGDLAEELGCSRRTLFRDLKNVENILAPYDITLVSVPGIGLELRGTAAARECFAAALRKECPALPGNKRERLLGLLVELFDDNNIHKLFYFAYTLGSSEATISNDLDELELWLAGRSIKIIRRPGLGVCYSGGEADIRAALVCRLAQDGRMGNLPYLGALGYPPPEVKSGVAELFAGPLAGPLDWMTSDSRDMLALFLVVSIERIEKGRRLESASPPQGGAYLYKLSDFIARKIEERFSFNLPQAERFAIARQLKTCRAMLHNPFNPTETRDYVYILSLVHEMIDRFDPELAPNLKLNERLLNGLSLHLWAALDRLEQRLELPNPMHDEIAEKYPDLFKKSLRALTVIEERLGHPVPASETSLIAMHFYAVLFNLEAQNTRKRMLRVCILCAGGIGVSYMLASQIRQRYKDELEIDLSDYACGSFDAYDFLISLMPLDKAFSIDKPVVVVNSFLTDEDHENIRRMIDRHAFVKKTEYVSVSRSPLAERVEKAAVLLNEVKTLLNGLRRIYIRHDCGFNEMVRIAAREAGDGKEGARIVEDALLKRETVSSQVLDRLAIVLLHAKTSGVKSPVLALLVPAGSPNGGGFTGRYFSGAKSGMLMLLPDNGGEGGVSGNSGFKPASGGLNEVMGIVSAALVENEVFLGAVHRGDLEQTRALLENEISEYLIQFCKETLKN
ncbi:MAG: transcription antiterminator [Spirochaetaceae bacterium]|nr:transcription antiterminator [Spirochaetaceae bacterium]